MVYTSCYDCKGHLIHVAPSRLLHETTRLKSPVILKVDLMCKLLPLTPSIAKKSKMIYSSNLAQKNATTSNSRNGFRFTDSFRSRNGNCQFDYLIDEFRYIKFSLRQ